MTNYFNFAKSWILVQFCQRFSKIFVPSFVKGLSINTLTFIGIFPIIIVLNLRRCVFVGVYVCVLYLRSIFTRSRPFFLFRSRDFLRFNDFKWKANELLYKRDELIGNITNKDDELAAKEDVLKVCFFLTVFFLERQNSCMCGSGISSSLVDYITLTRTKLVLEVALV